MISSKKHKKNETSRKKIFSLRMKKNLKMKDKLMKLKKMTNNLTMKLSDSCNSSKRCSKCNT